MIPLEIQFELKKRGHLQKHIARDHNVSEQTVSHIILKVRPRFRFTELTDPIMRDISKKIGRYPEEVFPEFYPRPAKADELKAA